MNPSLKFETLNTKNDEKWHLLLRYSTQSIPNSVQIHLTLLLRFWVRDRAIISDCSCGCFLHLLKMI